MALLASYPPRWWAWRRLLFDTFNGVIVALETALTGQAISAGNGRFPGRTGEPTDPIRPSSGSLMSLGVSAVKPAGALDGTALAFAL